MATLDAALDSTSTVFSAVPFDLSQPLVNYVSRGVSLLSYLLPLLNTLALSSQPTMLKALSDAPRNWIPDTTAVPPSHFLYLDQLGYIVRASGSRVSLWRESGSGEPHEFNYHDTVTCIGMAAHARVKDILIICTTKKIHVMIVQPSLRGELYFVPVAVNSTDLPNQITAIKGVKQGRVLLGGQDGILYHLKIELAGNYPEEGFHLSFANLTWEIKDFLMTRFPIRQIYVDSIRELAYSVSDGGEMNVLSIKQKFLVDKPLRVAVLNVGREMQLASFVVLPSHGFGNAVLLGASRCGKLYYFSLDESCRSMKEFTAEEVTKRAKTWCGIGLKKNLKILHVNEKPSEFFAAHVRDGETVEVAAVFQTAIYLSLYNHGTGVSRLWELRNGADRIQDLQLLESLSIEGKISGICPVSSPQLSIPGSTTIEKKLQMHELTSQLFYRATEMVVFSNEQHQRAVRRWPCEILEEIIGSGNEEQLRQFMESYDRVETCAMAISLCLNGNEAAEKLLLADEALSDNLCDGFLKYFRRLTEPVWLEELFCYEGKGSIIPTQILRVKLPSSVLMLFKDVTKKLAAYLRRLLIKCKVDVYSGNEVFVHSSSGITSEQARHLVDFKHFTDRFAQSMAFLDHFRRQKRLSLSKTSNKGLLHEIRQMSVRDFIMFVTHRTSECAVFFEAIKEQMTSKEAKKFDRFFKLDAPLLDPAPPQTKEDMLETSLSSDLKDLRKKIRSLNEQLGQFGEDEIPCPSMRRIRLTEHYSPVFEMLAILVDCISDCDNFASTVKQALQFVKVVMEVEHPDMRHDIVTAFALSPLGHKNILRCEPVFEEFLRREAGIGKEYVYFRDVSKQQQKAIERLIGFYEMTLRYDDVGHLHVILATRKHSPNLKSPSLEMRMNCLNEAKRFFHLSGKREAFQEMVRRLDVQKKAVEILKDRYKNYEKDVEDEQTLMYLDVCILPANEFRVMLQCWLADDDAETRAAFQRSADFKNLEELLAAIDWSSNGTLPKLMMEA